MWEKLFPGNSKRAILSKICAMNLLSDPLFFMPTFYIFKETLTQNALAWTMGKWALGGHAISRLDQAVDLQASPTEC